MDEVLDSELLGAVASMPVPQDLLRRLQAQLPSLLPQTAQPERVVARLRRFIAASRSPTALLAFFERDDTALPTLLRLLGTGSRLANQLIADPASFDLVRASGGADVRRDVLVDEIVAELEALAACGGGPEAAATLLRAVAGRERLRIAYGEFIAGAPLSRVSAQLAILSEALLEAALHFASQRMAAQFGLPRTPDGQAGRLSVIGLGALGARELGYDTPLELMFLCDLCGPSDGAVNLAGEDYFRQLGEQMIALLQGAGGPDTGQPDTGQPGAGQPSAGQSDTGQPGAGPLLPISLARRPLGDEGPLVMTVTEALRHYQVGGRTWERLLHVKSRVVAGDPQLGEEFLERIGPWVYRKYLQRADQEGIRAQLRKLARRLEESAEPAGDPAELTTAGLSDAGLSDLLRQRVGGAADIEWLVTLLQVIRGWAVPQLRVRSTSEALHALLAADCLSVQEAALLEEQHQFLRRYEHCLQVNAEGDFGTLLPGDAAAAAETGGDSGDPTAEAAATDAPAAATTAAVADAVATAAWNLGYRDAAGRGDAAALWGAVNVACGLTQQAIRRLVEAALGGGPDAAEVPIETELVLDPEPDPRLVSDVFSGYGMQDPARALRDLQRLADEPVPYLSSRRCRHFLAAIAPALLAEIGRTPDPHHTLGTLAQVSDSLGGKAVLWELFGTAPAALRLLVRLCACSPYLSGILIDHPGMIDELIDSLILDRLPPESWLEASSRELCRGGADIAAVLQGFKNGAHLQIGARDCLGKESVSATHAALAATAQCMLRRASEAVQSELANQFGDPITPAGEPVELVILALGKLGGGEPNYHSDSPVLFLYTHDCQTQRRVGGHRQTVTTEQFFGEVALRSVTLLSTPTSDRAVVLETGMPLEIAGSSAGRRPAVSLDALAAHFRRGQATLVQRLALCKARAISGTPATRQRVDALIRDLIAGGEWYPMMAQQIHDLRRSLEAAADPDNLKRAAGGTLDIELLAQTLQLCHARQRPDILVPGTLDALAKLADAGLLDAAVATTLAENYRALREVELKLRLLGLPQRHQIPSDALAQRQLACLLGRRSGQEVVSLCRQWRATNRQIFDDVLQSLR